MQRWIDTIKRLMPECTALEVALVGNLVKGYGETNRRGNRNLRALMDAGDKGASADQLCAALLAALVEPVGRQLLSTLGRPIFQPIRIVRRRNV